MITWEYPTVMGLSSCVAKLRQAHGKLISQDEATRIIFAYLDEDEVEDIRFTSKRGRGTCIIHGSKVTIRLPHSDYLTLGITVHEVAHALHHLDEGGRGHNEDYVKILDELIYSEAQFSAGE